MFFSIQAVEHNVIAVTPTNLFLPLHKAQQGLTKTLWRCASRAAAAHSEMKKAGEATMSHTLEEPGLNTDAGEDVHLNDSRNFSCLLTFNS